MIPLRDANPSQRTPVVNYVIIALCVAVFIYELLLGPYTRLLVQQFGVIPLRYTQPATAQNLTWFEWLFPLVASLFIHGGWLHLIFNMWMLYIFGDNIESALGHVRFVFFYLLCGLAATLLHILTNASSAMPTIGASGAIAGVMGAYLVLYPQARVLTLIPIFFFVQIIELPAYIVLGFWILLQFLKGAFSLLEQGKDIGGVAWWAHVGGFLGGIALLFVFKGKELGKRRRR